MALREADVRVPVDAPVARARTLEAPGPKAPPGSEPVLLDLRTGDDRRAQRRFVATVALIVLVAAVLRAVTLTSALPYQSYVDEGHVVLRADHIVAEPTWDPGWYRYPSLLPAATGYVTGAVSAVDPDIRRRAEIAEASPYYDVVTPDALLVGRLLVWSASVGTVVVTAILARRLAGRTVALVAAILVAALPALVSRSSVVMVDPIATFFVMACILATTWIRLPRRRGLAVVAAGACAGLAFTSKYTAALVFLVLVAAVAFVPRLGLLRRAGLVLAGAVAAGVAAVVTMPALVLRPGPVLDDVRDQAAVYATKVGDGTYVEGLLSTAEVGWVVVGLALVGLVLLLRSRMARPTTIGWLAYAAATAAVTVTASYQPFRNLLPFVPFVCIAAAITISAGAKAITGALPPANRAETRSLTTRVLAVVIGLLVAGATFALGGAPLLEAAAAKVDSRVEAVDWLTTSVSADQRVLVASELAIAPWEIDRIPGEVVVTSTTGTEPIPDLATFDFVVTARWKGDPTDQLPADQLHPLVTFGRSAIAPDTGGWRGNTAAVVIATPVAPSPASGPLIPSAGASAAITPR